MIEREAQKKSVLITISLSLGVLCWFSLYKINCKFLIISLIALSLLYLVTISKDLIFNFLILLLLIFLLGQASCYVREFFLEYDCIDYELRNVHIEGNVSKIEDYNDAKRLYLDDVVVENELALNKVRIKVNSFDRRINVGAKIAVRCTLMPPPPSSVPGGLDMERFMKFKGISAIGYTNSEVYIIKLPDKKITNLEALRYRISLRIKELMSPRNAGIATGILIGEASQINPKDFDAIRVAGTAHLIAISGMHIALIAGIVFFCIKWILARIEIIARRFCIKKISAFVAIFVTYFYLLLAGSPVSGERAFIMSILVLIAIILDKEIDAIKSLSLAIFFLILIRPENILSPSLQMSLAACLGLIAGFSSSYYALLNKFKFNNILSKPLIYICSITYSTLTAGLSAAIFIAYHFKKFSLYSTLSNMVCVPLTDFLIMPTGLLGLILMPFDLERLPFWLMEQNIILLLNISHFIAKMPNANLYIPLFSVETLSLLAIGLIIICTLTTILRHFGWIFIAYSIFSILIATPPDILISESGNIFGIVKDESLLISSRRKHKYTQNVWRDITNSKQILTLPKEGFCNRDICKFTKDNIRVMIMKNNTEKQIHYKDHFNLLINLSNESMPRHISYDHLLNIDDFINNGAHAIWIKDTNVKINSVHGNEITLR
jgi:competence protein ComEC